MRSLGRALVLIAVVFSAVHAPTDARADLAGPEGAQIADVAADPDGDGYWVVDDFGRVHTSRAVHHGELGWQIMLPGERVVAIEATPTGDGYHLFTSLGRVAGFGDAQPFPDLTASPPTAPIVDASMTPSGSGYVIIDSSGTAYTFGDAVYAGAGTDYTVYHPMVAVVAAETGYWMVDSSGGVWAFEAPFLGGANDGSPREIVDATAIEGGYALLDSSGTTHMISADGTRTLVARPSAPSGSVAISATDEVTTIVDTDGTVWLATGGTSADSSSDRRIGHVDTDPVPMAVAPVAAVATMGYRSMSGSDLNAWQTLVPRAQNVTITSSADGAAQPAMWLPPPEQDRPLLVVLHSWSAAYTQQWSIPFAQFARDSGWAMIAPNFRGVNRQPTATGSDLAVADVVDAVEYATARGADPDRVFIIGFSGGGHMALQMAGRHPDLFAGVASWVPVYDLPDWYVYNEVHAPWRHYIPHIEGSCGGAPRPGTAAYESCLQRSPMTHLDAARAAGLPVYIAGGLRDSIVPPSHAARAFNQLADPADRFTARQVDHLDHFVMPPELIGHTSANSYFGPEDKEVVISRSSGPVTFVLFNGFHEMFFEPALKWFAHGPASGGFEPEADRAQCRVDTTPPRSPAQSSDVGYWLLDSDGRVHGFGVDSLGDITHTGRTAVSLEATPTGNGYWIVDDRGAVHDFGDAEFHGDMAGQQLAAPIRRLVANPAGTGYWLQAEDGGVFTFGDAAFHGSTGAMRLAAPIVSMEPTPSGGGYWLLGLDGGVFSFGDAAFHGSTGAMQLNSPVMSMATNADGTGYWLHGGDGGVFAFGSVGYHGSVPGTGRCTPASPAQFAPTSTGNGYWITTVEGEVFAFGDAADRGRLPYESGTRVIDMAPARGR